MPYKLQVDRLRTEQMAGLEKRIQELSTRTIAKEEQEAEAPILGLMPQQPAIGYY